MNRALAAELKAMVEEDQRIRRRPPAQEKKFMVVMSPERVEWNRIETANTDRLREIVDRYGWPGRSLVGEEGAQHAWLLAQHADRQLEFQRRALALLTEAVEQGEATARQLAYLTDRVRMNEGREQVYGTQLAGVQDGNVTPWPIENPDELDARRAAVGLDPFDEYAAQWNDLEAAWAGIA